MVRIATVLETICSRQTKIYITLCSHSIFRWDEMAWNVTGEVESNRVDAEEELCVREDVNQNFINHVYCLFTSINFFQIQNVPDKVQCAQSRVVPVHGHLSQV